MGSSASTLSLNDDEVIQYAMQLQKDSPERATALFQKLNKVNETEEGYLKKELKSLETVIVEKSKSSEKLMEKINPLSDRVEKMHKELNVMYESISKDVRTNGEPPVGKVLERFDLLQSETEALNEELENMYVDYEDIILDRDEATNKKEECHSKLKSKSVLLHN